MSLDHHTCWSINCWTLRHISKHIIRVLVGMCIFCLEIGDDGWSKPTHGVICAVVEFNQSLLIVKFIISWCPAWLTHNIMRHGWRQFADLLTPHHFFGGNHPSAEGYQQPGLLVASWTWFCLPIQLCFDFLSTCICKYKCEQASIHTWYVCYMSFSIESELKSRYMYLYVHLYLVCVCPWPRRVWMGAYLCEYVMCKKSYCLGLFLILDHSCS